MHLRKTRRKYQPLPVAKTNNSQCLEKHGVAVPGYDVPDVGNHKRQFRAANLSGGPGYTRFHDPVLELSKVSNRRDDDGLDLLHHQNPLFHRAREYEAETGVRSSLSIKQPTGCATGEEDQVKNLSRRQNLYPALYASFAYVSRSPKYGKTNTYSYPGLSNSMK
ncbi:hypothetical protein KL929_001863 [Ogataea haglerorum]|uniref:uncharacterized protein n=1 Tax=Ogataea haglerorum TaxID=1937702 RepID=UPI001C89A2DD|nr:uncharacterized protein KL911_000045 [Ogataea haglerorum]KAG7698864.1 hypothetical protein KL915_001156 [Ogataea haglerorum]KAG7700467.1 hypothetical protein KL951_000582 [Ogataea haglerorum]KAG7711314.1 hypothetical protein KL950_001280 [Ogataea haglerorum]KAG7720611.1 hypothetical protein KL913_001511 [Ogataea haglerorum]KAG7720997.1 hypothetical protein KL949_001869 [Ogataea haglerorum]